MHWPLTRCKEVAVLVVLVQVVCETQSPSVPWLCYTALEWRCRAVQQAVVHTATPCANTLACTLSMLPSAC